ncbi:MAG: FtsQ-type POTRA domain-containing protein [Alphaproteobacteria bacterium]|nr:FtsQ-type POTRA domain-containing protein [Alphaproteobacteria bacterium]
MRSTRTHGKTSRGSQRQQRSARGARGKTAGGGRGRQRAQSPLETGGAWGQVRKLFRRPLLAASCCLALFVVLAGIVASGIIESRIKDETTAVSQNAGFGIQGIEISGLKRVGVADIVTALGMEKGQPIYAADLAGARRRLLAIDWVSEAQVKRRYPDSISVQIVEKVPYALWRSPTGLFLIERNGGVITGRNLSEFQKLPKLAGEGGNGGAGIVDAVAAHRSLASRVSVIERVGERRWNLDLDDGVTVKLPEKGWEKQLDILDHLIVDKGVLERDISEIDLRSPTHYFFVLKSAPKKDDTSKQI